MTMVPTAEAKMTMTMIAIMYSTFLTLHKLRLSTIIPQIKKN